VALVEGKAYSEGESSEVWERKEREGLTDVLQARAGFRLCFILIDLDPPCLSTAVADRQLDMIAKISPLILVMSLFSFFRTASAGEPKLKKISYRGGVVEFSIPANWKEEYEQDGGGMFYEQSADSATLRLNVITAKSPSPINEKSASDTLRGLKAAHSRQVDLLPNGNALLHFSEPAVEAGHKLHMLFWIVANPVGTNHVRVATFSYTLLEGKQNQARFTNEIALIDSQIRKTTFAKELGQTERSK
jgi:hypothetical protein